MSFLKIPTSARVSFSFMKEISIGRLRTFYAAGFNCILEDDECPHPLERKQFSSYERHTNCQSPLEERVMATWKVVIYSSNLMLELHNIFSGLGDVLSSKKETLSLLIFVSSEIKSGSTLFSA